MRRAGGWTLSLALLACVAGCGSSTSASGTGGAAGSGGASGSGGTAGAGAADSNGCPTAYVLDHYSGSTSGLCDPGASLQCSSVCDWGATWPNVECTPDGTACVNYSAVCARGPGLECGWTGRAVCPALAQAAISVPARTCTRDSQCYQSRCDLRVYNRMFCDNEPPAYARDYCNDARADGGPDGSGGGSDAGADAGAQ